MGNEHFTRAIAAEDFGRKCAREAWANRTICEGGEILVAEEPQSADFEAWRSEGFQDSPELIRTFREGYTSEIQALQGAK